MSVGWKSNAASSSATVINSADASIAIVEAPPGTFDLSALLNVPPHRRAWRDTPDTTGNGPGSPVTYLSVATDIYQPGVYLALTALYAQVSASNTALWADVLVNGAPSPFGPIDKRFGKANAQEPVGMVAVQITLPVPAPLSADLVFAVASGTGTVTIKNAWTGIVELPT